MIYGTNVFNEDFLGKNHAPDPEAIVLGTIIFDDVLNEKEIGGSNRVRFRSIGECKIEVRSREREIPHFHIYNKDLSFNTCICIYSPHYFSHGKDRYKDTLNSAQCKILDDWLRGQNKNIPGTTSNWETIMIEWENSNSDCKFPMSKKTAIQPDYTKMVDYKDV